MKSAFRLFLATATLTASAVVAQAQTFATGALALDGSNVENVGTVFEAIDITAGENYPVLTLNNVTFTQVQGVANGTSGPNFTLNNLGTDNGRAGGVTASDPVFDLVNDGTFNNSSGTGGNQTLTITGLTLGQLYSVQLFFDAGNGDARVASVTDGSLTSDPVTAGTAGPQFVTDVFTASGAGTETLVINNTNHTNAPLQFSGFVVEAVPEPSTYAMMFAGLALLGYCVRRKLA